MTTPVASPARITIAVCLAITLAGCDAPDRAVSPATVPSAPVFAASPAGVVAQSLGLRKAITPAAIRTHQAAFQAIADQNGGLRSSLNATHDAAAEYVRGLMDAAGFNVTIQPFTFEYHGDLVPPLFARVAPNPSTFVPLEDFNTMLYSGSGDVTGQVRTIDLQIPSLGASTSGCEAADFAGFPAGAIALIQRGTCQFRVKVLNAMAAGAGAVIIMNEGDIPPREGTLGGTLGAPAVPIPVIGTSYAIGVSLAAAPPTVRIRVTVANGLVSSSNVIAETRDGNPENVVVIGASLDGKFGPGINATSGGAAMIEIARAFTAQERSPTNRLRFIWFGAYPEGIVGSTYYVDNLTTDEKARIKAMLELHPLGSPNFGRFVVQGNQSGFPADPTVDAASGAIAAMFSEYFSALGLATEASQGVANSNPFRNAGIPFGGLHSGFGTIKTPQQAVLFGGTAGAPFDPCVWAICDSYTNVSVTALDQMSDAAAHVVLMLSKRDFARKPLAGN